MKNKVPLIVAVAIGGLALLAIRSYVNKMEQRTREQLKGDSVVAARVDIPQGETITSQMITPKEVPRQFIPPQAIKGTREEAQLLLGQKTRVRIAAGQVILTTDFVEGRSGGLSHSIPVGEGAYTVNISRGLKTGLIQVNDHIDILGSFAAPKPTPGLEVTNTSWRQSSDMVNVVLLQNVLVLAVGETLGGMSRENGAGDLTLSLTLKEAQLLMFAAEHGELGAVLRREGSTEVKSRTELHRVTFQEIESIIGDLDNKRSYRNVEIQKGAKTESVPVKK